MLGRGDQKSVSEVSCLKTICAPASKSPLLDALALKCAKSSLFTKEKKEEEGSSWKNTRKEGCWVREIAAVHKFLNQTRVSKKMFVIQRRTILRRECD